MLGGVAASLPRSTSAEDRRLANHALAVVRRPTLGSLGVWDLEPVAREDGAQSGKGPSRIWTTLTPFVFGRYPRDPWGAKAQTMVTEACGIAGLPEPVRVETGRQALPGVPPASGFPPLWHRPGRPRSFHVHVRLEFAEPVEGPVLVGAGRHRGVWGVRRLRSKGDSMKVPDQLLVAGQESARAREHLLETAARLEVVAPIQRMWFVPRSGPWLSWLQVGADA